VGGDGAFEEIGKRLMGYFRKLGQLKPHEAVLDVGCGCGRMARPLTAFLNQNGAYAGFDIDAKSIGWCQENISPRHPNFRFQHVDVHNKFYNPTGTINPEHFAFPYDSAVFDFVFLISVFTHLLPEHMERYYAEISRVLKKGGRCLITYYLMNPESVELINRQESCINFFEVNNGIYSTDQHVPERVIAYQEDLIRGLYAKYGFSIQSPFYYGSWCGRKRYVDFQDMVIARK
jgi:SAM-dependent methyltransferase